MLLTIQYYQQVWTRFVPSFIIRKIANASELLSTLKGLEKRQCYENRVPIYIRVIEIFCCLLRFLKNAEVTSRTSLKESASDEKGLIVMYFF